MEYGYVFENYDALRREIGEMSSRVGREVTLVCVTKSGSDAELLSLAAAGMTDLGENRPQELRRRGDLLRDAGYEPRLHEIGSLQRNKVKYIAEHVALIHSLDSLALAEEIERQAVRFGRRIPVLIEVNSGREEAKGGILPEEVESFFLEVRKFEHLAVSGLMTMGPATRESGALRECFRETRALCEELIRRERLDPTHPPVLSMGMSESFEIAAEEGATTVRVGRALFWH